MITISLEAGRKLYFASDFHLGTHADEQGLQREQAVIAWLDKIRTDAQALFLVGDLFDFWFEYRKVVPKGFIRFLGKISQLRDEGIDIHFFTGNHDLWMADYFPRELGIPVYHAPLELVVTEAGDPALTRHLLIGHGDGLGPGDRTYRLLLKPIFKNPLTRWAFRWLHPDLGVTLAHRWSRHTRRAKADVDESFKGAEKEWIYQYCREVEARQHHDYYVFGHRHLPLDLPLGSRSRYINLGEWLEARTYAVFEKGNVLLRH